MIAMSPLRLWIRSSATRPSAAWPSRTSSSEVTSPLRDAASIQTRTPGRTPMRMSPETDCADTGPFPAPIATWSPETLFSVTAPCAARTERSPETDCAVTAPSPASMETSPETVWSSALRPMRPMWTSALTARSRRSPASSAISTSPEVVSISALPKRPRASMSAERVCTWRSAPGGLVTRTSTSGDRLNRKPSLLVEPRSGISMRSSWPPARSRNSTRADSRAAIEASSFRRASSSTVVSWPSAVSSLISPDVLRMRSVSGPGVVKRSTVLRPCGAHAPPEGLEQPEVGGDAGAAGRRVDAVLELGGDADVHVGAARPVGGAALGLVHRDVAERCGNEGRHWQAILLSALREAGQAVAGAAGWLRDRARERADDPRVHRNALTRRCPLDLVLERVGETQADACGRAILGRNRLGGLGRVLDEKELGVPPGEANLDVAVRQLGVELHGDCGERVDEPKGERPLEGDADPLGRLGRLLVADRGDGVQVAPGRFDDL